LQQDDGWRKAAGRQSAKVGLVLPASLALMPPTNNGLDEKTNGSP
jgi:hypothetical protein